MSVLEHNETITHIALGLANGFVVLFRGNILYDKEPKQIFVKAFEYLFNGLCYKLNLLYRKEALPVTNVLFKREEKKPYLVIATEVSVMAVDLVTDTKKVLNYKCKYNSLSP